MAISPPGFLSQVDELIIHRQYHRPLCVVRFLLIPPMLSRYQVIRIGTKRHNWQLGCKQKEKVRESEERAEEEKAGDGKTSARGFAAFDEARGAGTAADREGDERTRGYSATRQSAACGGSRKVAHESLAGGRLEPGGSDQGGQALQPARTGRLVNCRRSRAQADLHQ